MPGLDVDDVHVRARGIQEPGESARSRSSSTRRAAAVVPQLHPADLPLPRERAKAPCNPAEIGGYLALADAQPTVARRMRAAGSD